jgi:tRNA1(Val) A37 N6-methylase TrmN6
LDLTFASGTRGQVGSECQIRSTSGDFSGTSEDAVLGGRLRLRQPLKGHRVGHDAILLAAATAAAAGELAIDFGAGVGGAGLALAARVDGLKVTLVEIDPGLCALATHNARLNGLDARVGALCADVGSPQALEQSGLAARSIDRVLMNPPFHEAGRAQASPDPRRRAAYMAEPGLLDRWLASAAFLLKPGGAVSLIWRADGEAAVLAALTPSFGGIVLLPVLPRPDRPAIRILVHAVKGGHGAARRLAPLILNDADGRPSAAAEAVLRGGATLLT